MHNVQSYYAPSAQNYFDFNAERHTGALTPDREPEVLEFSLCETYEVAEIRFTAR